MNSPITARLRLHKPGFDLDVELQLPGHGVSALFGPSGSGKTTCLRCLAGLERAEQAYVEVAGEVWQDSARGVFVPPHRRPLGYVFQEASLFEHLSVRDNLRYGWRRVPAAQRKVQLDQAASLLGIDALLQRRPGELSGGERQRVGIARALLTSPGLLLMDEPLAALDSARKNEILPYLERLHRELAIPVVYVSHSLDEVTRLADHLVLIDNGRVQASGAIGSTLARLDLPLAQQRDASVIVEGTVLGHDAQYQLLDLGLPASALRLRIAHGLLAAGSRLRVAIQARDVSLSLQDEHHSSILNRLPVTITALAATDNSAHLLVSLDADGTPLLARITRFSAEQLALRPGLTAWAQIKSVAVLA